MDFVGGWPDLLSETEPERWLDQCRQSGSVVILYALWEDVLNHQAGASAIGRGSASEHPQHIVVMLRGREESA